MLKYPTSFTHTRISSPFAKDLPAARRDLPSKPSKPPKAEVLLLGPTRMVLVQSQHQGPQFLEIDNRRLTNAGETIGAASRQAWQQKPLFFVAHERMHRRTDTSPYTVSGPFSATLLRQEGAVSPELWSQRGGHGLRESAYPRILHLAYQRILVGPRRAIFGDFHRSRRDGVQGARPAPQM